MRVNPVAGERPVRVSVRADGAAGKTRNAPRPRASTRSTPPGQRAPLASRCGTRRPAADAGMDSWWGNRSGNRATAPSARP